MENNIDRSKIKSELFFINNKYKNPSNGSVTIDLKPYNQNKISNILLTENSVIFYDKISQTPIDEINNINMDSNDELVNAIENRLLTLK